LCQTDNPAILVNTDMMLAAKAQ